MLNLADRINDAALLLTAVALLLLAHRLFVLHPRHARRSGGRRF
jgi:hypothetical protein